MKTEQYLSELIGKLLTDEDIKPSDEVENSLSLAQDFYKLVELIEEHIQNIKNMVVGE